MFWIELGTGILVGAALVTALVGVTVILIVTRNAIRDSMLL
jgi:hypothetical protein